MPESEDPGLFGRMKQAIGRIAKPFSEEKDSPAAASSSAEELNLPPCAARGDAACDVFVSIMKGKLLSCSLETRFRSYQQALKLIGESVSCMEKQLRNRAFTEKQLPELAFLRTLADALEMLEKCTGLACSITAQERSIEHFAGPSAITKLRMIEDASSDFEVSLLHNISALLEQMEAPMRHARSSRRRTFSRSGQERYAKAYDEFFTFFSSGNTIPEKKQH